MSQIAFINLKDPPLFIPDFWRAKWFKHCLNFGGRAWVERGRGR